MGKIWKKLLKLKILENQNDSHSGLDSVLSSPISVFNIDTKGYVMMRKSILVLN